MGRRLLLLAVLLLLLLVGAAGVYRFAFLGDDTTPVAHVPPPRPRPALPAPVPDASVQDAGVLVLQGAIRVVESSGQLERRGEGAEWARVAQGEVIQEKDSVRTSRDGAAVLQVGDNTKVKLSGRSELEFRKVGDGKVRVKLMEGRIAADVDDNGATTLQVETAGSDAVAESAGGRFAMMSDGRGQVAVATETGQVRLKAHGREVQVAAGRQAVVNPGEAPSAPAPIPSSLLLKVTPLARDVQRETETEVEGTASPGTMVRVRDRAVRVDERGNFRIRVPLKEGPNNVEVAATDAMGREKTTTLSVNVDTKAPPVKGKMTWGGSN